MRQFFRSFLTFYLFALLCGVAWGQSYPAHSIKIVYPFAPGAVSEVVLRMVAQRLSDSFKHPVIIENRPGAGSILGTDYVAKAAPDGYTLVASFNSAIAPGPLMHSSIPYDPLKDFVHIALIGVYPQFYVVRTDYPAKTLNDLLSIAKAKPGSINYASAGLGTAGFLSGELLKQTAGLNMVHVAYKGPAPALIDLMGGRLDMVITANVSELIRSGKVRILAITSEKRVKEYADVPTVNEIVPGVVAVSWMGISAPAKTPKSVTSRLEAEILTIVNSNDVQTRSADVSIGMTPMPLNSEKFMAFIQHEISTWTPVIKAGNIRVN